MKKINMFYIIGFENQTYNFDKLLKVIIMNQKNGIKVHSTALENHLFMLSKHFNVYNYYEYKHDIEKYDNALIYHIPYGRDTDTQVENELLKFKGKVPIVMRSYDPHSPIKTSREYMEKYHDLTITYLKERVNGNNILFGSMCYDNYLIGQFEDAKSRVKNVCMILRNREDKSYNIEYEEFTKKGLDLRKIYAERHKVVKNTKIDIFGSGWSAEMPNYKGLLSPFNQKYSALLKYKYNLILDNAIVDSYISEKILDSFLTLTVPIYLGSPTTSNQISSNCYIDISKYDNYDDMIDYILNIPENEYVMYKNNIAKNRKEIFKEFSTRMNISSTIYKWYNKTYNTKLGLDDEDYDQIENELGELKLKSSNDFICELIRVKNLTKLRLKHFYTKKILGR